METENSYEQMVRGRVRKLAEEYGLSVKELRKNMKEFGVTNNLYRWMESKIAHEAYLKNIEEEQFYNDGDIASLVAA